MSDQIGVNYTNGFGSAFNFKLSSGVGTLNNTFNNTYVLNETDSFVFWFRAFFNSYPASGPDYIFSSNNGVKTNGTSNFGIRSVNGAGDKNLYFEFGNAATSYKFHNDGSDLGVTSPSNVNFVTGKTYNFIVYKSSLAITAMSAFTTYVNGYKRLITSVGTNEINLYNKNHFSGNSNYIHVDGGQVQGPIDLNFYMSNIGMARTTMNAAEMDVFALNMLKYDGYYHLLPEITKPSQSDLIFYFPFYEKQGVVISDFSNNKSNLSATTKHNVVKGINNQWKYPYPPFKPYR